MKTLLIISALLVTATAGFAADDPVTSPSNKPVFREPFTLQLHVDKEHFYEQKFDKVPFTDKGNIYLFKGDEFGLTLDVQGDRIRGIKYQPDLKQADVTLKFTQEIQADGTAMMLLHIHNNTKQTLTCDALMTVPGKDGITKTSILPVSPGLSGYESWPHPIVQLVLQNVQVQKPQ